MRTFGYCFSGVLLFFAISLGIASCGTFIHGSREMVTIEAAPSSATILVDSQYRLTGFFSARLARSTSHVIEVSKAGYRSVRIRTGNSVSPWYFGNFFSFSLLGMIPDLITGGAYSIDPNPIVVQLTPGAGTPIEEIHPLYGFAQAIVPTVVVYGVAAWLIVAYVRGIAGHGSGF